VFAAETGFILSTNPDTVRAPDVAFATHEQLALIQDADSYLPFVPRLVVEVVSPSDSSSHVESKIDMWIAAGVKLALVADPVNQSLRVYRPKKGIEIVRRGGVLNADDAVAGWELAVDDIFS
jgi:Uma2 family endonuclease